MNASVIAPATMPIGMLTKKIQGHERWSTRMPPSSGPIEGPKSAPTAKMPCAAPCLSAGNVSRKIACACESKPPPPAPWTKRQRTSGQSSREKPHISEANVKIAIEAKKYWRRPKRRCSHGASGITMTFATT